MGATWDLGPGVVELPDGRRVRGAGLRRGRGDAAAPELAVLLTGRRPPAPPWPHLWVRWPDFWLPTSTPQAVDVLVRAHERAATGRVEVACGGGVGRTGAALAVLAALGGVPGDDAVAWVRRAYHPHATETVWQRRWVRRAATLAGARGRGEALD